MLANGLSAPQHSTYLVIFDDGLLRDGMPPGVAAKWKCTCKNGKFLRVPPTFSPLFPHLGTLSLLLSTFIYQYVPVPPGDRIWILSPFDMDIFRISENVLDDRRRSANAIKPWTDSLRRLFSSGPSGGSTGNDNDDLWLIDEWSSCSFSSVIVGVSWFLLARSSTGVRSSVSGVSGVRALQLFSGSDMHILFTDK